jgi:ABC-2 type transport system permease protein
MNTMKWLLKREFWENKGGFFWAPVIAGGLFVVLNVMMALVGQATADRSHINIGMLKLDQAVSSLTPEMLRQIGAGIDLFLLLISALVMLITAIVVFFYSIATLYDERRDRSILFWKSLPLSDSMTVLSKVLAAIVMAPLIGMGAGIATALVLLLFTGVAGLFYGANWFGIMFGHSHPLKVMLLLISTLPVAALWSLPSIGWLMLCSVAARSKPFLWAVALPVAAGVMVSWFDMMRTIAMPKSWFWEHVVARMLFSMFPGTWLQTDASRFTNIKGPADLADMISIADIYATFATPQLWIGAAAGIGMLVLATRLRRWRDDG